MPTVLLLASWLNNFHCSGSSSSLFTVVLFQHQLTVFSLSLSFSNVVSCGCRCPGWCLVTTTRHTVTQRSTLFARQTMQTETDRQTDIVTRAVANLTSGHLLINEWHKQIADMFVCFSISLSLFLFRNYR